MCIRDRAVMAADKMDVSYVLMKLTEEYTKFSKTEYLVVGGRGQYLELRTKVIRATSNFKYSGVHQ